MSYVERRRFLWIIFFFAIALAAAVANATTLARLTFDDLAQHATAIARLHCLGSESHWDSGEIWTVTRFAVVEREKGALEDLVTVRMLGGRADGFVSRVDGVPAFRPGDEVYLFLWAKPGEPYRVLGWAQGTFRIARDPRTGAERVTQESARTKFAAKSRQFQSQGVRAMALPEFREKLRLALEKQAP
jgi:hypothetical protein